MKPPQTPDARLDARGFICPLPILRARKALAALNPGQTLEVLATDPGAPLDFEAFCRTSGHDLLESTSVDGEHRVVIRVGAVSAGDKGRPP